MRKWIVAAGAGAAALLIGGQAQANSCANVTFTAPSFPQFDPINGNYPQQAITANLTQVDGSASTVRMILIDNDTGPLKLGSSGPDYDIRAAGTTDVFPSGTTIATNQGTLATFSSGSASIPFTLSIPNTTFDFIGGTQYLESLRYSVQCYSNSAGTGNGNKTSNDQNISAFQAGVTIQKIVSITTASPQTINFGNFTTATQTLQIGLKSTSSVNVSVSSGDQMVLAGAVQPYPTNSVIPYTMTLNGDSIGNGTSLINRARAGVAGATWPLILTLTGGVPSGKLAGTYSDTIMLTLAPGI